MQGDWGNPQGGGGPGAPGGGGFGAPGGSHGAAPGGGWGPAPGAAPPPGTPYGAPPPGGGALDPVSIAAAVLGALSLFMCLCCTPIGIALALAGAGLGAFGVSRANNPALGFNPTSKTLSIVGIVVGGFSVLLNIVAIILSFTGTVLPSLLRDLPGQ